MDTNYRHCENLVRVADKDRYLATLFAPADRRGPLFALYAFSHEIATVRDRTREPMPGEIRLQWWRDVLGGERGGEASANPVAAALMETVARFALPAPRLLDLVEAHAFDLYDDPMANFDVLEGYLRHTSATVFDLAALVRGAKERTAKRDAVPNEYTRVTVSLSILDERIRATQQSLIDLQLKSLPVQDVEQTLLSMLEARRLLEARLKSVPAPPSPDSI